MKSELLAEVVFRLTEPISDALGERRGSVDISPMRKATSVADETTKLVVRDGKGRTRAVALVSAPLSPEMVRRSLDRARRAKAILDSTAGRHILAPLAEGTVSGLTYALLPYCNHLSASRAIWAVQRALLASAIFDWLWRVTEQTVRDIGQVEVRNQFVESLRQMASLEVLGSAARRAADNAASRCETGEWVPKHVLMHGDLWKGNLLIRPAADISELGVWANRFVVIDWPGSEIDGYAIYDLVRLAQSMHLSAPRLRNELGRYCRLLQCDAVDSTSYLVAALAHIGRNIEHFPLPLYKNLVESCLTTVQAALA